MFSKMSTSPLIFMHSNYFRLKYLEIASYVVSFLIYIWVKVEHSLVQQPNLQKKNYCTSSSLQAA